MAAKPWVIKPLTLPVRDKQYEIQPLEYQDGLTLIAVSENRSKTITKKSEDSELFKLVMGPTWDEMLADKVPYVVAFRAGMSAVQYQMALVSGLDSDAAVAAGEMVWGNEGVDPELLAAALTAAQAEDQKARTPSTSTASARKIPSRASTRTTTSRQGTRQTASKAQPSRSSGKRSPSSGS